MCKCVMWTSNTTIIDFMSVIVAMGNKSSHTASSQTTS